MSAFSQHDEMPPLGECALCDLPADPVNEDGEPTGEIFQLIDHKDVARIVCERCWWKAWHGTDPAHVNVRDGVHAIVEPTAKEREALFTSAA